MGVSYISWLLSHVLGCTLQAYKTYACLASRPKKEPSQQQRLQLFNGWGDLHIRSKVLEQHPIMCHGSQDMVVVFAQPHFFLNKIFLGKKQNHMQVANKDLNFLEYIALLKINNEYPCTQQ